MNTAAASSLLTRIGRVLLVALFITPAPAYAQLRWPEQCDTYHPAPVVLPVRVTLGGGGGPQDERVVTAAPSDDIALQIHASVQEPPDVLFAIEYWIELYGGNLPSNRAYAARMMADFGWGKSDQVQYIGSAQAYYRASALVEMDHLCWR